MKTKKIPWGLVFQISWIVGATVAGVYLAYKVWGLLFDKSGIFANASAALDNLAEAHGFNSAVAATAPQINYDAARQQWRKNYGIPLTPWPPNVQGFVTEEEWGNGQKFTDPTGGSGPSF